MSLVEIAEMFESEHGASFAPSSIWRFLDRHGVRSILVTEGSGRPLFGGKLPRKKRSMGCCARESGDAISDLV